jgi:hypothetical protein
VAAGAYATVIIAIEAVLLGIRQQPQIVLVILVVREMSAMN